MEQEDHGKKRIGGKHFNWDERVRLESLSRALFPRGRAPDFTRLAKLLGRHRSSVSREYARGAVVNLTGELVPFRAYSARKAQDATDRAALDKGPRPRLTTGVAALLRDLILLERLSPYAAVMRLRARGDLPWVPCERSVYYAINAGLLGVSRSQLPYRPTGKRRKKAGTRMAYTNARGRPITERPPGAEDRSEYGHWEMDTVVGGTGTSPACLLVLTERMTRHQIVRKLPARTQEAVIRELDRLERSGHILFKGMKTITCDNGCEFLDFDAIEKSATRAGRRCEVFFAHPYRASERGSNPTFPIRGKNHRYCWGLTHRFPLHFIFRKGLRCGAEAVLGVAYRVGGGVSGGPCPAVCNAAARGSYRLSWGSGRRSSARS